jgi:antitoxin VapB
MNRPVLTRTFKSGNSVAVRLPKGFAIPPGAEVEMTQTGDRVTMRVASDPVEAKRRWLEALDRLAQLPPVGEIEQREPILFPDRQGL